MSGFVDRRIIGVVGRLRTHLREQFVTELHEVDCLVKIGDGYFTRQSLHRFFIEPSGQMFQPFSCDHTSLATNKFDVSTGHA